MPSGDFAPMLFAEFKRLAEEYVDMRRRRDETRQEALRIGRQMQETLRQIQDLIR